ncbi:hypothetical protein MesoLjLa_49740 [Mesorhizobium sp. L-2-11]|nr:hypothetical protein MesoLjLa_49740 [Mesorhizobium sp. L-2-11]
MRFRGDAAGGKLGLDEVLEVALQAVLALAHEAHHKDQIVRHQPDKIAGDVIGLPGHWLGRRPAVFIVWHSLSPARGPSMGHHPK